MALDGTVGQLIADLLQPSPPVQEPAAEPAPDRWFLGLDIGTTGISAVLLNRSSGQLHPMYWQQIPFAIPPTEAQQTSSQSSLEPVGQAIEKQFRLPLAISVMPNQADQASQSDSLIRDFKPDLNLTLPYDLPLSSDSPDRPFSQSLSSEPVLSWSDAQSVPLMTLRQSLQGLLAPLSVEQAAFSLLQRGAVDLDDATLTLALQQLEGIAVSLPMGWSDAYRFNVREVLLAAGIVDRPEKILFLEESIAALLGAFAGNSRSPVQMPQGQAQQDIEWQGNTIILSAGATQTELTLVQLPTPSGEDAAVPSAGVASTIAHADFQIRSLAYAGSAIDQDIVTQILYPLLPEDAPIRNDLQQIEFPAVGEPDLLKRERLQQELRGTLVGQSLLQTARALKLNLQQQNRYVVQMGQKQTVLLRQDLTTKVLLPYVQRLNRELNALLKQTQTPALNVRQVVCTGGTASLSAITRWLQQKLPNALILQDDYPWTQPIDCTPTCSRIAYGLATLPLYPFAFDRVKHQYSDFLLLRALIDHFPNWAMTLEEALELLQQKGIDAAACELRIFSILEGQLPAGLIPDPSQMTRLTPASQQNPDYQAIASAPLFHIEFYPDGIAYRIDRTQLALIRRYCDLIFGNTYQKVTQPYAIELDSSVQSS